MDNLKHIPCFDYGTLDAPVMYEFDPQLDEWVERMSSAYLGVSTNGGTHSKMDGWWKDSLEIDEIGGPPHDWKPSDGL